MVERIQFLKVSSEWCPALGSIQQDRQDTCLVYPLLSVGGEICFHVDGTT